MQHGSWEPAGIRLGVLIKMGQILMESIDPNDIRGSPQFGEPVKHAHSQAYHRSPYITHLSPAATSLLWSIPTQQNLGQRYLLVTGGGWGCMSENPAPRWSVRPHGPCSQQPLLSTICGHVNGECTIPILFPWVTGGTAGYKSSNQGKRGEEATVPPLSKKAADEKSSSEKS